MMILFWREVGGSVGGEKIKLGTDGYCVLNSVYKAIRPSK